MDRSTLAVHGAEADFRTLETALYQVFHRTTTNEPLRIFQQVQGQRGFEARRMIVRRSGQRKTSDRSSAYAALTSSIKERDRAEDVEQLNDILRNSINETNKFEGRFGKLRDEEKTLAVKKVDAREFVELSTPWHHVAMRRIVHRGGEHHHRQGHDTVGIHGEEN